MTVAVGFDGSANRMTRKPLASRYSVIPSTVGPRVTPAGSRSIACASAVPSAANNRNAADQRQTMNFMAVYSKTASGILPSQKKAQWPRMRERQIDAIS